MNFIVLRRLLMALLVTVVFAFAAAARLQARPYHRGGVTISDLRLGKGAVARTGSTVTVHYRGSLTNGSVFDESYKRHEPFSFTLGAGNVIKGWDIGVAGMRVGGKRRLVIPASLGYGAEGMPPTIPPNATLIFVVELLKVA